MESWITWIIQVVAYGIICFLLKRELNQFDQRDKRLQERIDEVEKKASADTKALAEKMDNFIQEANAGKGLKFPVCKAVRFYLTFILPLIILGIFIQGYWSMIVG